MKKLFYLILFLAPILTFGQSVQYLGTTTNRIEVRGQGKFDSALIIPRRDTIDHPTDGPGYIVSRLGLPYFYNGTRWLFLRSDTTTVPGQVNADWTATTGVAFILNKPTFATVATSGSYNDLSNKPTIPAAQVSSDWSAISGITQILNKPRFVDSVWRTVGKDSVFYRINRGGTMFTYSILDSTGGSGGSGTLTNITSGNLSPLFSVNITNPTSTPAIAYTLSTAAAHTFFGNTTGSTAAPSYSSITVGDLPTSIPITNILNGVQVGTGTPGQLSFWQTTNKLGSAPIINDTTNSLIIFNRGINLQSTIPIDIGSTISSTKNTGYNIGGGTTGTFKPINVAASVDAGIINTFSNGSTNVNASISSSYIVNNAQDVTQVFGNTAPNSLFVQGVKNINNSSRYYWGWTTNANYSSNHNWNNVTTGLAFDSLNRLYIQQAPRVGTNTDSLLVWVTATGEVKKIAQSTLLSAAITSINSLTASSQSLVTGTSGTDFNINSTTATHTFNIPTIGVGGATRGLVTNSLFTTWNSKFGPSDTLTLGQLVTKTQLTTALSTTDTIRVINQGVSGIALVRGSNDTLYSPRIVAGTNLSWVHNSDSSWTLNATGGGGGMTNPMTNQWDLIVGGVAGVPARFGIGANGQVLGVVGGTLQYVNQTGAVSSVGALNTTLTISPTTGNVLASINLANPNIWTGLVTANAGLTTAGTNTFNGLSYNGALGKFDAVVQDTTTNILYRKPVQYIDTTGVLDGYIPVYNAATKTFKMQVNTGGSGGIGTMGVFDGNTSSGFGASIVGSVLYMQSAGTNPGLVNIGTQTFLGAKTFNGPFQANSTITLPGLAYSTSPLNRTDVLVQDTVSFAVSRRSVQYIDTTGAADGYVATWNNTTKTFVLSAVSGTGTVTNFSAGTLSPLFTTSVATSTSTPALTFGLTNASAHKFFGNFTGSTGTPSYSSPLLASADFINQGTTTTLLHGNASGNPSWSAVSLTTDVTNTLPATSGGTGQSSYAVGDILYASTTTALSKLADVSAGNVLLSGGIGNPPTYGKIDLPSMLNSNSIPIANVAGGVSASSLTFLRGDNTWQVPVLIGSLDGQTASVNGQSYVGNTLYAQSASSTRPGLVNIATQSFSGTKTFLNGAVIQGGSAEASKLRIAGNATGVIGLEGKALQVDAFTYTDNTSSGTVTSVNVHSNLVNATTYAATNAVNYGLDASTFYINGEPIAGSNVTFGARTFALTVGGRSQLLGKIFVSASSAAESQFNLSGSSVDPTSPGTGDIWFNSTTGKLNFKTASSTIDLLSNSSGSYTATTTNGTNVTSSGSDKTFYLKSGNQVSVWGRASFTLTSGTATSSFTVTLPVASTISNTTDIVGNGTVTGLTINSSATVVGDIGNGRAVVSFFGNGSTTGFVYYSFSYTVQ